MIKHRFVNAIPETIPENEIFISIEHNTCIHLCACGCGYEVVTPLSPRDWRVTYDGASISLTPSIGNWNFKCQSHYWIKNGEIVWADQWSPAKVEFGRQTDLNNKKRYYGKQDKRRWYEKIYDKIFN